MFGRDFLEVLLDLELRGDDKVAPVTVQGPTCAVRAQLTSGG